MQQSDLVLAEKGKRMATSNSPNFPTGEKSNTSLTLDSRHASTLSEINDELAELLVIYQKAGGDVLGITLPDGKTLFGTSHILVLPASKINNAYALKENNVNV